MSDLPRYETLLVTREEGIVTVLLNRPDQRNAMNPTLHQEMHDLLAHLSHDQTTRVLVIAGAGECFSVGNDLQEYLEATANDEKERARLQRLWHDWAERLLRNFPHPTIARVHGWCYGAALSVVCHCDFALAAEDARFGLSEVNFGSLAGGLVPKVVMGVLPYRDVVELAMTGEPFDGRRAAALRLVNRALPAAQLAAETTALAQTLAAKDAFALRTTKEALHQVADLTTEQAYAWLHTKTNELRGRPARADRPLTGVE